MGKLAQAMIYGAKVIMINGNFDVALGLVREFTENNDVTLRSRDTMKQTRISIDNLSNEIKKQFEN